MLSHNLAMAGTLRFATTFRVLLGTMIFGGLYVNFVHSSGWRGRRQFLYLALTSTFLVATTLLGSWQPPASPSEAKATQARSYPLGGSRSEYLPLDAKQLQWQPIVGQFQAAVEWRDLESFDLRGDLLVSIHAEPQTPAAYAQLRVYDEFKNAVVATSDPIFQTGGEWRQVSIRMPRGTGPQSLQVEVSGVGRLRVGVDATLIRFPR